VRVRGVLVVVIRFRLLPSVTDVNPKGVRRRTKKCARGWDLRAEYPEPIMITRTDTGYLERKRGGRLIQRKDYIRVFLVFR